MGQGGAAPSGSYFDEVTADGPVLWWRHGEPSGTTMLAQAGTNGVYVATPGLGQPALYSGGPTTMEASAGGRGEYTGTIPSLPQLTVECIVRFNAIGSFRGLVSNDYSFGRAWQMRLNGSDFEFVKIQGGVHTQAASSVISAATTYHLAVSVSNTGVIILYVNGTAVSTSAAVGGTNYGGLGGAIEIGYMTGGGGSSADARFSESAIYDKALSPARILAHSAAAGL